METTVEVNNDNSRDTLPIVYWYGTYSGSKGFYIYGTFLSLTDEEKICVYMANTNTQTPVFVTDSSDAKIFHDFNMASMMVSYMHTILLGKIITVNGKIGKLKEIGFKPVDDSNITTFKPYG